MIHHSSKMPSILLIAALSVVLSNSIRAQAPADSKELNRQDTYIAFDLKVQHDAASTDSTLPDKLRNKHTSSATALHVERGFDQKDGAILNLTSLNKSDAGRTSHPHQLGEIRMRSDGIAFLDRHQTSIPLLHAPSGDQPSVFSENGIKPTGSPLRGFVVTSLNDLKRGSNSTLTILGTGQAQVTFTNPKHPEMSRTMLYSLSGSQWILTRVTTSFNNGTRTTSTVADISVTGWNKNTSADARRAGKHDEKIKQSPLMQSNTATFSSGESLKTLASPALGEGYLVGSANSGTGEANIQSTAMAATPMTLSGPGVGINVVYVHGFNSSGQTWSKMQPWLQSDFNFNQSLMPSIGNGGRDELADWTSQLNSYLPSVSPLGPSYLAIGHSAGGLVSRGEADYNSHTVGGVITIDTPHQGDMLLDNGVAGLDKLAVYGMNWVVGDMCSADAATCATLANLLGIAAVGGIEVGIGVETPALIDLQYKSLYTQGLNLVPETYPSAGIVGVSDPRWLEFRLGGDLADGPTGTYGGQNLATTADATYWTIDGLSWLFWGIAEDYYDDDDYDDGDYYMWLSDLCTDAENGMDWLDSNFNHYVTTDYYTGDSDPIGSDGIVQATSQYYPNSLSTNIVIPDADSHMGATQSQLVRAALDTLLSNQFFVAPPVHLTCCRPIIPPGGPQN